MPDIDDEATQFVVVHNDEEQYSIWPVDKPLPDGWYTDDVRGPKQRCLGHIEQVWTDMRPKSLRESMAASTPST